MRERSTLGNVFSTPAPGPSIDLARLGRLAVLTLAAARVSRFFTTDKAGEWWVVGPAKRWAWKHERPSVVPTRVQMADPNDKVNVDSGEAAATPLATWGWRSKAVSIFDCGFCMTPWLMGAFLIAEALTSRRVPVLNKLGPAWRWLTLTLAGAYVAGHTWNRLDNQ